MVQLTTSFVAVAAVAAISPAFAAPVIEAREPKFKTLAKVGGAVASGASLGMSVAPVFQQREFEELEARKITGAQVKSIARGAGKIAGGAQSGIQFGAAVAPLVLPHKQQQRRSLEYDLVPRKFHVSSSSLKAGGKFAAGAAKFAGAAAPLQQREFEELEARKITGAQVKSIARGAGKIAGGAQSGIEFGAAVAPLVLPHKQQQRRSLEYDLVPRKFHVSSSSLKTGGKLAAGAAGFAGAVVAANAQQSREFDESDIEAREPLKIGGIFKAVTKFIREDEGDGIMAREYELVPRKFHVSSSTLKSGGKLAAGAAGFAGAVVAANAQQSREFDESDIEAREPFKVGSIFKAVTKFIRDDEDEGIMARDYELVPRKFHVSSSTLKSGGKLAAGAAGFAGAVVAANAQQSREFDESDIEAREPLKIGGIFRAVTKFIRDDQDEGIMARDYEDEDFYAREFDGDTDELLARDFDEAEIEAREPLFIGSIIKGVGKVAKKFIRETDGLDELD